MLTLAHNVNRIASQRAVRTSSPGDVMDALHAAIDKIRSRPEDSIASTFSDLLKSLDSGEHFDLTKLYQLNYADFSLAMSVLKQWRLDAFRYERGAVSRAAIDPAVVVSAIELEYGRQAEPAE